MPFDSEDGNGRAPKRQRTEPLKPNHIVLMTIRNALYPIDVEVIHKISTPIGRVQRIVIFRKNGVQALVEFESVDQATRARQELDGADIYQGCCTLKLEFAKPAKLNVYKNDKDTWDYTGSLDGKEKEPGRHKTALLGPPPMTGGGGGNNYGGGGVQTPSLMGSGPGQAAPSYGGGGGNGGYDDFNRSNNGRCAGGGQPMQQGAPAVGRNGGGYGGGGNDFDGGYGGGGGGGGGGHHGGGGGYGGGGVGQGNGQGMAKPNYGERRDIGGGGQGGGQGGYGERRSHDDFSAGGGGRGGQMGAGGGGGGPQQGNFNTASATGGTGGGNGGHNSGCVLMVYGLAPRINTSHLFNLFCLYGNVIRVKFLRSKPGCAMVQMGDGASVERAVQNVHSAVLFEQTLQVNFSKQPFLHEEVKAYDLPDGSPSFREFSKSRNNRFSNSELAAKNRIRPPSNTLHFFNAPSDVTEERLRDVFTKEDLSAPVKVTMFENKNLKSQTGMLEFETIQQATEALVVCNHAPIQSPASPFPFLLKLCFTSGSYPKHLAGGAGGSDGQQQGGGGNQKDDNM